MTFTVVSCFVTAGKMIYSHLSFLVTVISVMVRALNMTSLGLKTSILGTIKRYFGLSWPFDFNLHRLH